MLTNTAEERGTSKGRVDSFRYHQILLITSGLSEGSEAYSARSGFAERSRPKERTQAMANDPGLSNDNCIFMEATTGDGGSHNPSGVWWLSPDINLVGPLLGPDNADPGQINPVKVAFHRKPASSNCSFSGDENLTLELWVANPSLVISPRVHLSTTRVAFIGAPMPAEGEGGVLQIDWNTPAAVPHGDPQSPGHKCLVARVY